MGMFDRLLKRAGLRSDEENFKSESSFKTASNRDDKDVHQYNAADIAREMEIAGDASSFEYARDFEGESEWLHTRKRPNTFSSEPTQNASRGLLSKFAAPTAELSETTPVGPNVRKTIEYMTSRKSRMLHSVGDFTDLMRESLDAPYYNGRHNAHRITEMMGSFNDKDTSQFAMIVSKSFDEENKPAFLKSIAAEGGIELLVEMMAQNDPVARDPETMTAMADAASVNGKHETFSALKNLGAQHENSEAYVAIMGRDFTLAEAYINEGADMTAVNKDGNTLLHAAGRVQSSKMAEKIIEVSGPDIIHERNADGKSFLSMALDSSGFNDVEGRAHARNIDMERMIDLAADHDFIFTQTDNKGNTLLHDFAACRRDFHVYDEPTGPRYNIERRLAAQGIDKMAKNNAGQTAGDIALSQNGAEVSAILAGNGYLPSTEDGMRKVVENSFISGRGHALKRMEEHGVDWVEDMGGAELAPFNVVLKAAEERSPNPIKAARTAGLSFDVRNERLESPFSLARDTCNDQTMKVMTEIKSDIITADIKDKAQARMAARSGKSPRQNASEDVR